MKIFKDNEVTNAFDITANDNQICLRCKNKVSIYNFDCNIEEANNRQSNFTILGYLENREDLWVAKCNDCGDIGLLLL